MIGNLQAWRDDYELLPQVGDNSWKNNLANYLGDLLDDFLSFLTYISPGIPAYPAFLFDRATFSSGLTDTNGVAGLQAAFASALSSSTFTIPIGTTFGAATPAETFSTVGVAVVDAASVTAGQAKLAELATAPQVGDASLSDFPVKLRDAFLLLTYTITGTSGVPGPINDALRAVE